MQPKKEDSSSHRINRQIKAPRVRVISEDGEQLGIMTPAEAVELAESRGQDLVEVSPAAHPPVCRVMDYGKFKYQIKKRTQEAKKNQKVIQVKEIKLRPKTDDHDLETKLRQIREFLEEGDKVKVTMRFRGREVMYAENALETMVHISKEVGEYGEVEKHPALEGKNMSMFIAPKAKKQAAGGTHAQD